MPKEHCIATISEDMLGCFGFSRIKGCVPHAKMDYFSSMQILTSRVPARQNSAVHYQACIYHFAFEFYDCVMRTAILGQSYSRFDTLSIWTLTIWKWSRLKCVRHLEYNNDTVVSFQIVSRWERKPRNFDGFHSFSYFLLRTQFGTHCWPRKAVPLLGDVELGVDPISYGCFE